MGNLTAGLAGGAIGTEALNITTYLDMALRGRPPSEIPNRSTKQFAERLGLDSLAGEDGTARNRRSGTGALMGYATGLSVGALYGLVRSSIARLPVPVRALVVGATAMAVSDIPLTLSGLTDPKRWTASDWAEDIVPHIAFGLFTVLAADRYARAE